MAISTSDFLKASRDTKQALIDAAKAAGPVYQGKKPTPLIWHDQFFVRNVAPSGTIESEFVLRVGGVQSAIDVVVIANHANAGPLTVPAAATIKLELLQSDAEDGTFTALGPAITMTAPADGLTVEPDRQVIRFAVGNTELPWVKAKLTVTGNITGGNIDVALAYLPR